jgi:hypothetical protein
MARPREKLPHVIADPVVSALKAGHDGRGTFSLDGKESQTLNLPTPFLHRGESLSSFVITAPAYLYNFTKEKGAARLLFLLA